MKIANQVPNCTICAMPKTDGVKLHGKLVCPDCRNNITQPIKVTPRPGRNSRCPCGSGQKYKNCCGSKYESS